MLNLIINKVLIILLFMDMYELFYLNISNNLLNFFIYLTLFSYFLSTYFMLFEKKIKDFIFFSSMSNNSFIVLNLLNNISEISLI
jgi:formate hydrogenlyase subunit 3/multisubunit Na+/H+ antiporter MnhD subunit